PPGARQGLWPARLAGPGSGSGPREPEGSGRGDREGLLRSPAGAAQGAGHWSLPRRRLRGAHPHAVRRPERELPEDRVLAEGHGLRRGEGCRSHLEHRGGVIMERKAMGLLNVAAIGILLWQIIPFGWQLAFGGA